MTERRRREKKKRNKESTKLPAKQTDVVHEVRAVVDTSSRFFVFRSQLLNSSQKKKAHDRQAKAIEPNKEKPKTPVC